MKRLTDIKLGKFISLILRHKPEVIGISLDKNGWADVKELIEKINLSGRHINIEILERIVKENEKKRYKFNEDKTKIKANQGHSINVELNLQEVVPPNTLYHGTAKKYLKSIKEKGILKGKRQYVYLSLDMETAINAGKRYGEPLVLKIDVEALKKKGHKFYLSDNKIWLSDDIPSEFIKIIDIEYFLEIKNSANSQDPFYMLKLAKLYEKGWGVKQNYKTAFRLYKKVLEVELWNKRIEDTEEYKIAQYKIGEFYEKGWGVKQNYERAAYWYRESASFKYKEEVWTPVLSAKEKIEKYRDTFEVYKKEAEKGISIAQFWLAEYYEEGLGVKRSYKKAFEWYKKSIEQGLNRGAFKVAYFYEYGLGVKEDFEKALKLYIKFANEGDKECIIRVGDFYKYSKDNSKEAVKWYKKANDITDESIIIIQNF